MNPVRRQVLKSKEKKCLSSFVRFEWRACAIFRLYDSQGMSFERYKTAVHRDESMLDENGKTKWKKVMKQRKVLLLVAVVVVVVVIIDACNYPFFFSFFSELFCETFCPDNQVRLSNIRAAVRHCLCWINEPRESGCADRCPTKKKWRRVTSMLFCRWMSETVVQIGK